MSAVIWKFSIPVTDHFTVEMPLDANVLHVDTQAGHPCIWALVDPMQDKVPFRFRMVGTGHPVDHDPGAYIGTFQMQGGALVFHLFMEDGGQ